MLFTQIEMLRIQIAKHQMRKRPNVVVEGATIGMMNRYCGSLDYQINSGELCRKKGHCIYHERMGLHRSHRCLGWTKDERWRISIFFFRGRGMVLATRLKIIISVFSCMLAISCHSHTEPEDMSYRLGENFILITTDEKHCYLTIKSNDKTEIKTTELSPPCALAIKDDGDLLTYSYQSKSVDAVAIIVGNPIPSDIRKDLKIDGDVFCGEKKQAVLLKNTIVSLSDWASEGGVSCPSIGIDEKVFYGFAHPETHKP